MIYKYLIIILIISSYNNTPKKIILKKLKSTENQINNWQPFNEDKIKILAISKTGKSNYNNIKFDYIWDKKLSLSDNIGYYGGIKELKIYKNNKPINVFNNIEDGIALGTIRLRLYDYNLDGHIDFTIPIECGSVCWEAYYLYNPKTNKFEHRKDWDYLRIREFNKITKQIRDQPYGNDAVKTYQIDGLNLVEIK